MDDNWLGVDRPGVPAYSYTPGGFRWVLPDVWVGRSIRNRLRVRDRRGVDPGEWRINPELGVAGNLRIGECQLWTKGKWLWMGCGWFGRWGMGGGRLGMGGGRLGIRNG